MDSKGECNVYSTLFELSMTYKSLIYTKKETFVIHTIQKSKNMNEAKYA